MRRFLAAAMTLFGGFAAWTGHAQAPQFPVFRPTSSQQQPGPAKPQSSRGLILGRVVDASTRRGVANVAVRLRGNGVAQTRLTDDRGRYYMSNLPAGEFTIDAQKSGYFDGAYGRTRAGGDSTSIALLDGQSIGDADILLWRPAVLAGYLVDEMNEPLVGVRVQALRRQFVDGRLRLVPAGADTTDDEGAYRIFDLLPGPYVIAVPSSALTVPAGELQDLAATSGAITPALLALLTYQAPTPASLAQTGTFDPKGETLTVGSQPALSPAPDPSHPRVYPTLYYPGTTLASMSTPIEIATAEVRANVTLQLMPVTTASVSGIVSGPDGPVAGQVLRLVPRGERDLGLGFEVAMTISGKGGRFQFDEVPAGEYELKAQNSLSAIGWNGSTNAETSVLSGNGVSMSSDPSGSITTTTVAGGPLGGPRAMWGEREISVLDRDLDDVDVSMDTGRILTARATFDGSAPAAAPDALRRMRVTLQPIDADRDAPRAFVDESGAYVMRGIAPGRYVLAVDGAPLGWTLQRAQSNGRDISASPVDVQDDLDDVVLEFTDHPSTLTGAARDSRGYGAPASFVAIFPADDRDAVDLGVSPRRIRGVRTNSAGVFSFGALPPGDYWLVGMSDAISEGWQAPESLRALQRAATRVTIRAGASISHDVTVVTTKPSR